MPSLLRQEKNTIMASSDSNGMNQHQQPSENTNNHSPNNHRNHHHHYHDEEAGGGPGSAKFGDYESSGDPFDIPQTKNASLETLKRWRVITLQCHCCPFYRFMFIYLFIYLSIYAFSIVTFFFSVRLLGIY